MRRDNAVSGSCCVGRPIGRAAFTVIELVVVIAVVGVLAGLLLPAIMSTREASRKTECGNRLGQLARATMAFESARGFLPSSWRHELLPYVDQKSLYTQIHDLLTDGEITDADVLAIEEMNNAARVEVYTCPSDSATDTPVWGANYFGCYASDPHEAREFNPYGEDGVFDHYTAVRRPGVRRGRRLSEIVDGLQHTTLMSELRVSDGTDNRQPIASAVGPAAPLPGWATSGNPAAVRGTSSVSRRPRV